MKEVLDNIQGMIRECKDNKNPSRVRENYKEELKEIYYTIERELHLRYSETDGLETGSPGDYDY